MSFAVLIPTAGTGSRLGALTRYINKSLVSIDNRPAICHIIERFPDEAEFVVALGYRGDLVEDFLRMAYPGKAFRFVRVSPYEGEGSGLGLSVLCCEAYLHRPFVFVSCDTLVKEAIPAPDRNWMGYAFREGNTPYRTLEMSRGAVSEICEKGAGGANARPYIGLAGIYDHEAFWDAMRRGGRDAVATGESYGLRNLLSRGVSAIEFTWYDTGNLEELATTREAYKRKDAPNILEKANEAIWFVGDRVVKFSDDEKFIKGRIKRAGLLEGYVPAVTDSASKLYSYRKVPGRVLSEAVNIPVFESLLDVCRSFWARRDPSGVDFRAVCRRFYRDKTLERVALFYRNFERKDTPTVINGVEAPPLAELFDRLEWGWLSDGLPGRCHGDFHFENIIYTAGSGTFTFIDWRQDFGGLLEVGDIYYDLAKLLHGLIVCHELIALDRYRVEWREDGVIDFDLDRKHILVECERHYLGWLAREGYDVGKVRVLTALVYLNIAALHHHPYGLMLYALGKEMLWNELEGIGTND